METNGPQNPENTNSTDSPERSDGPSKPLTVVLAEDLVRKLKLIAVMKDVSISTVIEGYVAKLVKADIKKMIGKLEA